MPYINIRVTDTNITNKQKRRLIEGATQLVVTILGKKAETTHVIIDKYHLKIGVLMENNL